MGNLTVHTITGRLIPITILTFAILSGCNKSSFQGKSGRAAVAPPPGDLPAIPAHPRDGTHTPDQPFNPAVPDTIFDGGANELPPTDTPEAPVPGTLEDEGIARQLLRVPCGSPEVFRVKLGAHGDAGMDGNIKLVMAVQGEFCPEPVGETNIVLVVDFSGSMGVNVFREGEPGNDPQVNGSCARLEAVRRLVDELQTPRPGQTNFTIGMVPFAGKVMEDYQVAPGSLADFESSITADNLCRFVRTDGMPGENDEGALAGTGRLSSGTNYEAAFERAKEQLDATEGKKVIFFITDGTPTVPAGNPWMGGGIGSAKSAGLDAANALRQAHPDTFIHALFLHSGNGNDGGLTDPGAEAYLKKVAGDNGMVTPSSADQLADNIIKFGTGSFSEEKKPQVTFSVPSYDSFDLELASFGKKDGEDIWEWTTRPVVAYGQPGTVITNTFEINATDNYGRDYSQKVEVEYLLSE